jgi:Transport and Golgi organisation 2
MCTVTFIPTNSKYFITASRDEKNIRRQAFVPAVYEIRHRKLIFPKDGEAGGTWIALHENGNAAVLLNGAFEKHSPDPPYRKSRGKILLNIIAGDRALNHFFQMDLKRIEPFTLVLFENKNLYECRWDGKGKHLQQLKSHRPCIWSSVTLYDQEAINKRDQWFTAFLNNKPNPAQKDILEFHQFTGDGENAGDLLMGKEHIYSTLSITSILLADDRGSMKYLDLKNNTINEREIKFRQSCEVT